MDKQKTIGWFHSRCKLVAQWRESRARALWAGLELLCAPVSILTLLALFAKIILERCCGTSFPAAWNAWFHVLLTAAIGYGTNFIAIEMLFKPFEPTGRHWLPWLTLGFWKQGMIPKNKNSIAVEIGTQVDEKLLPADTIVEELGGHLLDALDSGDACAILRKLTENALLQHQDAILEYLKPKFLTGMEVLLQERFTPDKIRDFLLNVVLPAVNQQQTRNAVSEKLQTELAKMSPQITVMLKEQAVEMLSSSDSPLANIPFLNLLSGGIAQGIAAMNWNGVEQRVGIAIRSEKSKALLMERLGTLPSLLRDWFFTDEGKKHLAAWTEAIWGNLRSSLAECYQQYAPQFLNQLTQSEVLWNEIGQTLLPNLKPHLEGLLQTQGKQWLAENLHLGERVTRTIERQDVRQFYEMINAVSAQHLGAIQVLGFFLGAVIGLLQLLA